MSTYRYQPGDRPLDGYTVRAPAGRGGFGEVYFAESDAGREVALKALYVNQGYDEIELRGIRHCMNLKSPHLVSIFDVKTGLDGTPFVVMEYVAGPSLRDLLNDSPQGLGHDKAAFFLREVAKGLSHLHGYGVVHRDLKPANIFYEDGYVKIGDYGLSKLMTADPVASQTVTVGTVHYMAPEIGVGKYDKSIDLYALGCLLYEMLTGKVPYSGASPTEVLMKHLQAEPELDDVPKSFAKVIRKALQKDPAARYASATEMVEDLFGAEHVRNSVSQLNADELSVIAQRVGQKVVDFSQTNVAAAPGTPRPASTPTSAPPAATSPDPAAMLVAVTRQWPQYAGRVYLALAAVLAVAAGSITGISNTNDSGGAFMCTVYLLLTVGPAVAWAASRNQGHESEPTFSHRLGAAIFLVIAHALIATPVIFSMAVGGVSARVGESFIWVAFISMVVTAFVYWPKHIDAKRALPFTPGLWITVGLAAALPTLVFVPQVLAAAFALPVIIALGAQLLSPTRLAQAGSPTRTGSPAARFESAPAAAGWAPSSQPNPQPERGNDLAAGASHKHAGESRHSRTAALLLCMILFPTCIGGLHRFYTGRWVTGLLWLCTFGLLGIGQLIDGVRLLTGEFEDSRGRAVNRWGFSDRPPSAVSGSGLQRIWTPRIGGRINPFAMLLHLVGILFLVLGIGLITPVFLSIPEAFKILPALADAYTEIARTLDYGAWPRLLQRLLVLGAVIAILAGTIAVGVARRGGPLHLVRAVVAGGLLLSFVFVVSGERGLRAVYPAEFPVDLDRVGVAATVDQLLALLIRPELFIGLCWVGTAGLLLVIPARRLPTAAYPVPEEATP